MTILDVITGVVKNKDDQENVLTIRRIAGQLGSTKIDVQRLGERTTLVLLTEKDGWETVGIAHTLNPWSFDLLTGSRYALEDAVMKLGSGRFFDNQNHCVAQCAQPQEEKRS